MSKDLNYDPWREAPPADTGLEVALKAIASERASQDAQWGGATHDDAHGVDDWFDYIRRQMEKIEQEWSGDDEGEVRAAYVKIAALACAAIESYDRLTEAGRDPVNGRLGL